MPASGRDGRAAACPICISRRPVFDTNAKGTAVDADKDYVGVCQHGKTRAWCAVDCGGRAKEVAKAVGRMLLDGLSVQRVTTEEAKAMDWKCPECDAAWGIKRKKKAKA